MSTPHDGLYFVGRKEAVRFIEDNFLILDRFMVYDFMLTDQAREMSYTSKKVIKLLRKYKSIAINKLWDGYVFACVNKKRKLQYYVLVWERKDIELNVLGEVEEDPSMKKTGKELEK